MSRDQEVRGYRSLFERLERLERPAATSASSVTSVANHLGKMLSIRAGSVQTLPDYGMPDLNDMNQSLHESLSQSRLLIERFIRAYEPRLKQVKVMMLPRGHDPLALAFAIEATLVVKGVAQPVVFTARLSDSGRVEVMPDDL
ncbi:MULTISPECIES: type VI secretion system baseplate subunit TssE [unclassified Pseudomonas]|uniref:type VI secretion system baseplate subunit TssE n=1 Tax=unclassified Pseudomonas TaxID=196821 RepID=UPI001CA48F10